MKKIFKYKTLISFSLVFILAFGVVTDYKEKETNAFILVDDLLFWTLGTLVLSAGVVAVNQLQVTDMGKEVYNNFKLKGYSDADLMSDIIEGSHTVVKISTELKQVLEYVSENLRSDDKEINTVISLPTTDSFSLNYTNTEFPNGQLDIDFNSRQNADYIFTVEATETSSVTFKGVVSGVSSNTVKKGINIIKVWSMYNSSSSYPYRIDSIVKHSDGTYTKGGQLTERTNIKLNVNIPYGANLIKTELINTIPYSNPIIKQGYNPTYTNDNLTFPVDKEGYIPIPSVIPTDVPISTEMPLNWDKVKDNIKTIPIDVPQNPPIETPADDVLDIPNEGSIELPSEQTGLWGWLSALLRAIFNILKAILNAILGFINALLEGLLNLLKSLFVPTDTYFTDSFNSMRNSFGNRLNIDSYTRLFNSDYNDSSIKDITINIYGKTVTIVKFSMYENFRNVVNTLIYAFMFFLLAIYNYSQVYKLIRGSDYVSASSTITHMGGGMTPQDYIKADSISRSMGRIGGKK